MSNADTDPAAAAHTGSGAARGGWWRWLGVAGLCLAIWGGLALVWPLWEKHRAYEIVAEHFEWDETEKTATLREESMGTGPGALQKLDRRTARALRVVGTTTLVISDCPGIKSVAELKDIATLHHLTIWRSEGLTSVAGLPPGVQELDLTLCTGLTSVAGLPTGVQTLRLCGCDGLTGVAGLSAGVQSLDFSGCAGLTSVAGLPAGVHKLDLSNCTGLTNVAGLPAGVQELNLTLCTELTSVSGLPPGVQTLDLSGCQGLTSVDGLPAGLTKLHLWSCTGLTEVGSLPPGLKEVNMQDTPKLPEAVKAEIRGLVKKNGGEVME